MVNSSGTVVAENAFDPFGVVSYPSGTPSVASDFGYADIMFILQAACLLTATRAYMPSIGRFINRDTIGEAGGINLYGYVRNNRLAEGIQVDCAQETIIHRPTATPDLHP